MSYPVKRVTQYYFLIPRAKVRLFIKVPIKVLFDWLVNALTFIVKLRGKIDAFITRRFKYMLCIYLGFYMLYWVLAALAIPFKALV